MGKTPKWLKRVRKAQKRRRKQEFRMRLIEEQIAMQRGIEEEMLKIQDAWRAAYSGDRH